MRPGTLLRTVAIAPLAQAFIKDGSTVVDVGGCDGYALSSLRGGRQSVVLDVDLSNLRLARHRGLNAVCASALTLPLRDNSVDVVLCLDVLPALCSGSESAVLTELRRVLRREGTLILTDIQPDFALPFTDMARAQASWRSRPSVGSSAVTCICTSLGLIPQTVVAYHGFIARFAYAVLYFHNIPPRGTRLKRWAWRLACSIDRAMCLAPQGFILVATAQ